jgi:fatty acid desaturase
MKMSDNSQVGGGTAVLERPRTRTNLYADLKQRMRTHGLMEKRPISSTAWILLVWGAVILGVALLFVVHNIWLQLADAAYLALVYAQISYVSHDAGHRQIYKDGWKNDFVAFGCALIMGMSKSWWVGKHNEHHSHPNQIDLDPDLNIPFLLFTEDEARHKARKPLARFVVRHQAALFFPALCFVTLDMKKTTLLYLIRNRHELKQPLLEWSLYVVHMILAVGILLYTMGFWPMLAFIAVNQGLLGFVLGSAFAPNHKGMPVLERESTLDFLHRQVITSRNIYGDPFVDFWYGGLNYQIEHHLFPTMPRRNLKHAQVIVKTFCQEYEIDYAETNILGSYRAILQQLREVGMAQSSLAAADK